MILTAHQPVYLPWLGLFHKIALADHFVWFDDVQYQTKDWNNRNKIKTANGTIWLSVPVERKDHFNIKLIDIKIDNSQNWAKKHLKSIEMAYMKAPYFSDYFPFFESTYLTKWELLSDLNWHFFCFFLKKLNIDVSISRLSKMHLDGVKSSLVLNMCQSLNADIYIFGAEGKNYADVPAFKAKNIEPIFQDYQHPKYNQLHGCFESHLSALDLLFNCGHKSRDILMQYNLSKNNLREKTLS